MCGRGGGGGGGQLGYKKYLMRLTACAVGVKPSFFYNFVVVEK